MIYLLHDVLDSSTGPYEFEVTLKEGHAELWMPGLSEPILVTERPVRFLIDVPGEPRPIRMKAWLLNKG